MFQFKKILFILVLLIFLCIAFIVLGYLSLRRTVPEMSGMVSLAGLSDRVEIGRDEWGIPHIKANTESDLYFAAGYVSAQDRIFQMDLLRRVALGECAEVFGKKALPIDILARTLNIERTAEQILRKIPPEYSALLQSYTSGINAYLKTSPRLALEFNVAGYQPKTWRPEDSIACTRLIAWLLSMGWHVDMIYGDISQKVDLIKLAEILPQAIPGTHSGQNVAAIDYHESSILRQAEGALRELIQYQPQGIGSNAWVVAGSRSSSGGALLANDTHLAFTAPVIYNLMHWTSPKINAVGVTFPGIPGIVIGRNKHIAWGITNAMIDDVDFFQVQPDSADSSTYVFHSQQMPFMVRDDSIAIQGESPYKLRVRWTHMGPVIGEEQSLLSAKNQMLCLRWTGFDGDDSFTAFQKIMCAGTWSEFTHALALLKSPGENFFYADDLGNIGYQLAAAVPVRNYKMPFLPIPDSLRQADWLGMVPFEQLPHVYNPPSGMIANANNCMVDSIYSWYLSAYWEPAYRFRRIQTTLDTIKRISLDQCMELQNDVFSGHAAFFVPRLLTTINKMTFPDGSASAYGRELLRTWDYQEGPRSIAASIYEKSYLELLRLTFCDEMGEPLFKRFLNSSHINVSALDRMILSGQSRWFDNVSTADTVENLEALLAQSYLAAVDSLSALYGENIGLWSWGEIHTVTFPHLFGRHRPFRRFFDVGPFPCSGSNFTLNNSTYSLSEPFAAVIGPCVRQLIDLSTQDYHVVITTGQSGHPFSSHYRDMAPLWCSNKLITLHLRPTEGRNPDWQWLLLRPSNNSRTD